MMFAKTCRWNVWMVSIALPALLALPVGAETYYVDQSHASAADTAPGSEDKPFKTISAALAKIKPGDTIYVKNGTYRESVIYTNAKWEEPNQRMTLAAFPTHRPVVKGSDVVAAKFEPVRVALRKPPADKVLVEYDPDAWRKTIGVDGVRKAEAAPVVAPPGAEEAAKAVFQGIYVCTWETCSSLCFADGQPLAQVGLRGSPVRQEKAEGYRLVKPYNGRDVADMRPGTFHYDAAAKKLYVWLADSSDPNKRLIEAGVRGNGVVLPGTWTVSGLDVMHFQDLWNDGQTAVALSGHKPIIENCRILHNGFIGLIVHGWDGITRNCEIGYSGVLGLSPSLGWRMLIEGCDFHHNDYLGGLLTCHSGEKICQYKDSRIIRNRFHDTEALWLDINVNNLLIAENIFENCRIGVYYEISRWGVIVNNVFRNCGRGIHLFSSDTLVAHNVFEGCGEGITVSGYARGCAYHQSYYDTVPKSVNDCLLVSRNNLIVNNIIVNSVGSYLANNKDDAYGFGNYFDHNAFVWLHKEFHEGGNHIKFMAGWDDYYGRLPFWRMERHYDENSIIADPAMHNALRNNAVWPEVDVRSTVGDPRFADRTNGDYSLRSDSPLRGKGIAIPPVLNSVYLPAKGHEINSRPWAPTANDSPEGKGRKIVGEVWGQKFYRIQPLPQLRRLVDLDEQGPADPGINYAWRETGKYPRFRSDAPAETVPADYWMVHPENRLPNGNFAHPFGGEKPREGGIEKVLKVNWQLAGNGIRRFNYVALAHLMPQDAGTPARGAQRYATIKPNTEYLLWADMKVDSLREGYTTTGRIYLAATGPNSLPENQKKLAPIKTVEVTSANKRIRHWNTHVVYYKSGPDAKSDPLVGQDLYVVFATEMTGPKAPAGEDPFGRVQWDNFQLLTSENPAP